MKASIRRTRFVALRIVRQVLRDKRSLALILVVPVAVVVLLGYVLRHSSGGATLVLLVDPRAPAAQYASVLPSGVRVRFFGYDGGDAANALLANGDVDGVLSFRPQPSLRLLGDNPQIDRALQAAAGVLVQAFTPATASSPTGSLSISVHQIVPGVPTSYVHGGPQYDTLDYEAPALIGFFAYFFVFLLTSVSFLRERTSGTLERLLIAPLRRMELVSGYTLGFGFFALVQSFLLILVVLALGIHYAGNLALAFLMAGVLALGAVNLGIFLSAFSTTELQAIQFIPVVLVPQTLLCGLLFALKSLPGWLQVVSHLLPLTYATDGLRAIMIDGHGLESGDVLLDLLVLAGFALLFVVLGALTLRGETA